MQPCGLKCVSGQIMSSVRIDSDSTENRKRASTRHHEYAMSNQNPEPNLSARNGRQWGVGQSVNRASHCCCLRSWSPPLGLGHLTWTLCGLMETSHEGHYRHAARCEIASRSALAGCVRNSGNCATQKWRLGSIIIRPSHSVRYERETISDDESGGRKRRRRGEQGNEMEQNVAFIVFLFFPRNRIYLYLKRCIFSFFHRHLLERRCVKDSGINCSCVCVGDFLST